MIGAFLMLKSCKVQLITPAMHLPLTLFLTLQIVKDGSDQAQRFMNTLKMQCMLLLEKLWILVAWMCTVPVHYEVIPNLVILEIFQMVVGSKMMLSEFIIMSGV